MSSNECMKLFCERNVWKTNRKWQFGVVRTSFPFVLTEQINLVAFSFSRVHKIPEPNLIISKNKIIYKRSTLEMLHACMVYSVLYLLVVNDLSFVEVFNSSLQNKSDHIYIYDFQDSTLSHYSTVTIQKCITWHVLLYRRKRELHASVSYILYLSM